MLDEHYNCAVAQELRRRGETHFGVIFTDDATFPRMHAGIGLIVRALAAFVQGTEDDDLLDSCLYLPRP